MIACLFSWYIGVSQNHASFFQGSKPKDPIALLAQWEMGIIQGLRRHI